MREFAYNNDESNAYKFTDQESISPDKEHGNLWSTSYQPRGSTKPVIRESAFNDAVDGV
jgi:hypothetical protein